MNNLSFHHSGIEKALKEIKSFNSPPEFINFLVNRIEEIEAESTEDLEKIMDDYDQQIIHFPDLRPIFLSEGFNYNLKSFNEEILAQMKNCIENQLSLISIPSVMFLINFMELISNSFDEGKTELVFRDSGFVALENTDPETWKKQYPDYALVLEYILIYLKNKTGNLIKFSIEEYEYGKVVEIYCNLLKF